MSMIKTTGTRHLQELISQRPAQKPKNISTFTGYTTRMPPNSRTTSCFHASTSLPDFMDFEQQLRFPCERNCRLDVLGEVWVPFHWLVQAYEAHSRENPGKWMFGVQKWMLEMSPKQTSTNALNWKWGAN